MQCKDIPDIPILKFLESLGIHWGYLFENFDCDQSILRAMPKGVPYRLALAKMKTLIRRGLINGCTCGCRGDYELTEKGRKLLEKIDGLRDDTN